MNITKKPKPHWPQLKQELPTLIYLAITQICFVMYSPTIVRLGEPLSIVVGVLTSIVAVCFYSSLYIFPEKYLPLLKINPIPNRPEAFYLRAGFWAMLIGVHFAGLLLFWYIDYYRMSNAWYAAWYLNNILSLFLIYQILKRYQDAKQTAVESG